jgi:hypothetical protein
MTRLILALARLLRRPAPRLCPHCGAEQSKPGPCWNCKR